MSGKKILGFSLFGIIRGSDPWKVAHEIGMKELSERAEMPELLEKVDDDNYFDSVVEALGKIDEYKSMSKSEQIKARREGYFARVLNLIMEDESLVNSDFVEFLKDLKKKYKLMLITTNPLDFVEKVLRVANASDVFDDISCLKIDERDDKKLAFEVAIKKFGKPDVFIGSVKSGNVCRKLDIDFIGYETIDKLKEELREDE